MDKVKFQDELKNKMLQMEINLTKEQCIQFYEYMKLLIEWNKKMNLTAITEPKEIILKHFIDSLAIQKYIQVPCKIIDIGTGAGFPGIPLKIVNPTAEIILLDSLRKRIKFLEEVIEILKLKNIKAIHGRAEEFGRNKEHREQYDYVVSRAVANTRVLAEYTLPYVKKGGKAIYMKGPEIEEELVIAKGIIKNLGGKVETVEKYNLLKTDIKRSNIIIRKESNTSNKYPRKNSQIKQK